MTITKLFTSFIIATALLLSGCEDTKSDKCGRCNSTNDCKDGLECAAHTNTQTGEIVYFCATPGESQTCTIIQ